MDAVYILGSGSLAADAEIKYSLRALQENMLDLENVYVVGELPDFLQNVRHIPATDPTEEKWKNAYIKICKACAVPELSADFLLMNDDFFMLDPFTGADWPFYALKNSNGGACGPHSYHVHCPIRLNKEMYIKMPFALDSKACKSPRTFYANFYGAPPKLCEDFILRAGTDCRAFDEQIKGRPCFSVSNTAMQYDAFASWLQERWPQKSRFEI